MSIAMENANQDEVRQWVLRQTAHLDPPAGWQPDTAAALTRMHARQSAQPRRSMWAGWPAWAAAGAMLGGLLLLLPTERITAQLWQFLTVPKVALVRVNPWPEGVPAPQIQAARLLIPPIPAHDVEEVRSRVRYEPRLPLSNVLSSSPRLSTAFGVSAGTVIHTADLELALQKSGVTGVTVPAAWDGAQLRLHSSALVIAEWPGLLMVQSLPLTLTAPPGFDFPEFSALILRILGVGPDEAEQLARRTGTTPAWLAPLEDPPPWRATLEEIKLNSGDATLYQETGADGTAPRITLLWMVPDRVYLLDGHLDRDLIIAVANAVR